MTMSKVEEVSRVFMMGQNWLLKVETEAVDIARGKRNCSVKLKLKAPETKLIKAKSSDCKKFSLSF
jgi:hypothetical protein